MILFHMKISPTIPQDFHCWFFPQTESDKRFCIYMDFNVSKITVNPRQSPQDHSCFNFLVLSLWIFFKGTPLLSLPPHPAQLSAACRTFHSSHQQQPTVAGAPGEKSQRASSACADDLEAWTFSSESGPRRAGPQLERLSEGFSAGSTVQAKLAAPCFSLWIRLENLGWRICIKNVCSKIILLAVCYSFQALRCNICSCILFGM